LKPLDQKFGGIGICDPDDVGGMQPVVLNSGIKLVHGMAVTQLLECGGIGDLLHLRMQGLSKDLRLCALPGSVGLKNSEEEFILFCAIQGWKSATIPPCPTDVELKIEASRSQLNRLRAFSIR
jgi:hypothetical protein